MASSCHTEHSDINVFHHCRIFYRIALLYRVFGRLSETYMGWGGASLVAQRLKRLPAMQETWVRSLGWEDPLEKEMATHSSILAWRIPWTEEPGGLQSTGSQRVGHDWATSLTHSLLSSRLGPCNKRQINKKKIREKGISIYIHTGKLREWVTQRDNLELGLKYHLSIYKERRVWGRPVKGRWPGKVWKTRKMFTMQT